MQLTALSSAGMSKVASIATKSFSSTAPDFGTVLDAVTASGVSGPTSSGSQAIAKNALAKSAVEPESETDPKAAADHTRDDGNAHATPQPAADAATAAATLLLLTPLPVISSPETAALAGQGQVVLPGTAATATPPLPIPFPVASSPEAVALPCPGQVALPGTAATAITAQSVSAAAPTDSQAPASNQAESLDSESVVSGSTTVPETSHAASPGSKPSGAAGLQEAAVSRSAAASQFVSCETQFPFPEIPGLMTQTATAQPPQAPIPPNPPIVVAETELAVNRAPQLPAVPPTAPGHLAPEAISPLDPTLSKAPSLAPALFVATLPASSGQMPAEKSPVSRVPPRSQAIKIEQPPDPKVNRSPGIDQTPNQVPALIYAAPDSTAGEALPSESGETEPSEAVSAPETGMSGGGVSVPSSIPTSIASTSGDQATGAQKPVAATDKRVAGAPESTASTGKKSPAQVQADTIPPEAGAPPNADKDAAAVAAPVRTDPASMARNRAEQPPELPKTHQMLDSAPAGAPVSPPARIASEPSGQVQMHVGVRTTAFGTVEIHTVVQQNQVGIAIHGERGLAHWFSSEVGSIESGLKDHRLNLTVVDFDNGRSGVQTATSFHQGQPHRHFSETTSSGATFVEDQAMAGELETVETLPPDLGIGLAGPRVSIRV